MTISTTTGLPKNNIYTTTTTTTSGSNWNTSGMTISTSGKTYPKYSLQIGNTTLETEDVEFLAALRKIDPDCCSALAKLIKDMKEQDWSYHNYTGNMTKDKTEYWDYPLDGTLTYKKGEDTMEFMKNCYFGPCGDRAKISPIGIAIKNANGEWVSYDRKKNEIVNVDLFNFGNSNLVYMIPVALKDIAVGDAVIHNKHIMFVSKIKTDGITVIDVTDGEYKKILPTKSMFGFDFMTKVVSLIDFAGIEASADNPFGNLLPFLLMNGEENNSDTLPLALMMMNNGINGINSLSEMSPWVMMMALKNNSTAKEGLSMSTILPLMMFMNQKKEN